MSGMGKLWDTAKRTALAMVPIPFIFVGNLLMADAQQAVIDAHDVRHTNISMEMVLAAAGVLAGAMLFYKAASPPSSETSDQREDRNKKDVARVIKLGASGLIAFAGFVMILVVARLLPQLYGINYSWLSVWGVPNFIGLVVLAIAVRADQ